MRLLLHSLRSGIAAKFSISRLSALCCSIHQSPGKKAVHSIKIRQNDMQIAKTLILVRAQQWRRLFGGKQAFSLPTNSIKRKVEKSLNFYVVCLAHSIFHASLGPDCMAWWSRKEKQSAKGFQHDKLFCIQMLHLITSTCRSDVDRTSRDVNADHNWHRWVTEWVPSLQRWDARASIGLTLTMLFDQNNPKRCVFGCPSVFVKEGPWMTSPRSGISYEDAFV